MHFQYPEDKAYFVALLCEEGESLATYATLFDFRPLAMKRQDFQAQRATLLQQLRAIYGGRCQLQFPERCNIDSGITIDHIIPLASNKLHKEVRGMFGTPGKKVPSQSFGSNHINNLIIACRACNNAKKHRLLERHILKQLLGTKHFVGMHTDPSDTEA